MVGFTQNVTVIEGNNATLCVNFSSKFATNFSMNVRYLLTELTLDGLGKSIHMRLSIEWTQWNEYTS